jgi:hypothetical protein
LTLTGAVALLPLQWKRPRPPERLAEAGGAGGGSGAAPRTLIASSLLVMPANNAAARTLISSSSLALTEYCPVTLFTSTRNSTSLPLFDSVPLVNS